jgi:hypothetical protein
MEDIYISETSVGFQEIIRHYIPEDRILHWLKTTTRNPEPLIKCPTQGIITQQTTINYDSPGRLGMEIHESNFFVPANEARYLKFDPGLIFKEKYI